MVFILTKVSERERLCDSDTVLEEGAVPTYGRGWVQHTAGGGSNIRQGVQCNFLFLAVEMTNPKCHMNNSIIYNRRCTMCRQFINVNTRSAIKFLTHLVPGKHIIIFFGLVINI